jgi:hypothetical protein
MAEAGEKSTSSTTESEEEKEKHACKWSSCEGKHEVELDYPDDGNLTRDGKGSFRERCISANMEPWKKPGKARPRLSKLGNRYETKTFEYQTQAHHLVPVKLLENTTTLKDNLKLVSYDIDNPQKNGLMLPMHQMDIPVHDLQIHMGSHCPAYKKPIQAQLKMIEITYDGICNGDKIGTLSLQRSILIQLEILAKIAEEKIINMKTQKNFWPLHNDSLAIYNAAQREYARREKLSLNQSK